MLESSDEGHQYEEVDCSPAFQPDETAAKEIDLQKEARAKELTYTFEQRPAGG
ncbi:hypothetical protein FWH13_00580 [Candidatus Saccharibacteria bacterium]|nr:hypothetical protein [Candidatus Saccharibacteria bacterium]